MKAPAVAVNRFADGSMAVFCGDQAMHLRPAQATEILWLMHAQLARPGNHAAARPTNPGVEAIDYDAPGTQISVWDAVIAWRLGFLDGNAVEHIASFRRGGSPGDLVTARSYLDRLIKEAAGGESCSPFDRLINQVGAVNYCSVLNEAALRG